MAGRKKKQKEGHVSITKGHRGHAFLTGEGRINLFLRLKDEVMVAWCDGQMK
jgi:hypothetical protein